MARRLRKQNIREAREDGRVYYELYRNNKFVMHIGNAEALRVFRRNVQIGEEAMRHLQRILQKGALKKSGGF